MVTTKFESLVKIVSLYANAGEELKKNPKMPARQRNALLRHIAALKKRANDILKQIEAMKDQKIYLVNYLDGTVSKRTTFSGFAPKDIKAYFYLKSLLDQRNYKVVKLYKVNLNDEPKTKGFTSK